MHPRRQGGNHHGCSEIVAKNKFTFLYTIQLRVPHCNDSSVCNKGDSGTAGKNEGPFLLSCDSSCSLQGLRQEGEPFFMQGKPKNNHSSTENRRAEPLMKFTSNLSTNGLERGSTNKGQLMGIIKQFNDKGSDCLDEWIIDINQIPQDHLTKQVRLNIFRITSKGNRPP